MPPEEVFAALLAGNQRTQSDETRSPNCSIERRTEIAKGQHPLAVVVTCSDSRVPPERIFDQGYGDLFVVRSAGNVVDDVGLGSIEYAVDHLGARLIFVLGHTKCGAVGAAVQGGPTPGHLPAIMRAIAPAVEKEKDKPGDLAFNAMLGNVRQVVLKIAKSTPQIKDMIEAGTVRIVGGYYDLDTSAVNVTFRPVL
jgi:carbonic anhydrase